MPRTNDALGQRIKKAGHSNLLIHDVPDDIKNRFKAACGIKGIAMKKVLLKFMRRWSEAQIDEWIHDRQEGARDA
jgi:hypothetical protein